MRQPLTSLAGLIREAARVYARVKDGKMDHEQGRSLVWILSQMRAMLEAQHLERIEQKLDQLSEAAAQPRGLIAHGHTSDDRPAGAPHCRA